jgi:hypothetical protein
MRRHLYLVRAPAIKRVFQFCSIVAVLCMAAPLASADTVNLSLTGVGLKLPAPGFPSHYISPYAAKITKVNGSAVTPYDLDVICLDLHQTTYVNSNLVYDVTQNSGPADFGANSITTEMYEHMYKVAARLAVGLFSAATDQARSEYAFAIWTVFDGNALDGLSVGNTAAVVALIEGAQTGWVPNFTVYTPPLTAGELTAQRLMTVHVPEPSAIPLLGLNLGGLLGLILVFRRRLA